MIHQRLKKILASFALSSLILLSGLMSNSVALAATPHMGGQDRDWREDRRPDRGQRERLRREEREEMGRVREMDREHRLRYRMNNQTRMVGYYDQFGNFHQYGYYDRWGYFHRY
jgi:hypothetical protein